MEGGAHEPLFAEMRVGGGSSKRQERAANVTNSKYKRVFLIKIPNIPFKIKTQNTER